MNFSDKKKDKGIQPPSPVKKKEEIKTPNPENDKIKMPNPNIDKIKAPTPNKEQHELPGSDWTFIYLKPSTPYVYVKLWLFSYLDNWFTIARFYISFLYVIYNHFET